jgi:hypothetical protein
MLDGRTPPESIDIYSPSTFRIMLRHNTGILLFLLLRTTGAFLAPLVVVERARAGPVSEYYPLKESSSHAPSSRRLLLLYGRKQDNGVEEEEEKKPKSAAASWFDTFQEKPGTLIVLPFLLLFGLDLVANIAAITRRSIEYAFTGQYTTWHF